MNKPIKNTLDLTRGFSAGQSEVLRGLRNGVPLIAQINPVTGGRNWRQGKREYNAQTPIALLDRGLIESDDDGLSMRQEYRLTELGRQVAELL